MVMMTGYRSTQTKTPAARSTCYINQRNAPAVAPAPVANSMYLEHSNRTTPYQPDVYTCDFNVEVTAVMLDIGVYREGWGDETRVRRAVATI